MKFGRVLPLAAGLLLGASQAAFAWDSSATITVNDTPGYWFDAGSAWDLTDKDGNKLGGRSLVVVEPGSNGKATVHFKQKGGAPGANGKSRDVESFHTVTNLVWPATAGDVPVLDQDSANWDNHTVELDKAGLYVFVCKLHPYMLGAVIVDDPKTDGVDLGNELKMLGGPFANGIIGPFPTASDLGLRLLRAFFIVTNPSNWKDYTKVGTPYQPKYPHVPVAVGLSTPLFLDEAILGKGYDGKPIEKQQKPKRNGIGEVWVDTAYELSHGKPEWTPGTATVVSATGWNVKRKIALPEQKMNNGHNFWPSHDQKQIYQTEWHGTSLYVINRHNGKLIQEIDLVNGEEVKKFGDQRCNDPAHVMTRLLNDHKFQVHVGCNGGDAVVELDRDPATGRLSINRFISMQDDPSNPGKQTQPHAHWMGHDGNSMVTPNSNTGDSSLFRFDANDVVSKKKTGTLPIATGMMPDSSKYYVSNYLGDTISVICGPYPKAGCQEKTLNLLDDNADNSGYITDGRYLSLAPFDPITNAGPAGGFSVQTPVSPDGRFVVIGNTLSGTITIIDTKTDTLVRSLACDPGCHGVNFGAKKGGGYYAYVTSKFANRLIVLDYDPNNDGNVDDAVIAGAVVLAKDHHVAKDDHIIGNKGFGGQGVMPVPNVYNGWVQELPNAYKAQLTKAQRNPIGRQHHHDDHHHDRDDDHK